MGAIESKTFKSGNSVAVRLPANLGIEAGTSVTVERVADEIRIRPVLDPAEEKRKLTELVAALRELGPIPDTEPREPIEFPERAGL